jgi:ABC-type sugar transport system substrate-binding protein
MLRKLSVVVAGAVFASASLACGAGSSLGPTGPRIVLGFSQVGAESGWRTANTISIHDAAQAAGIKLRFSDAQAHQANQIAAIRSYIAQKVNVIAFSPVVESGWDDVLTEAKSAGIPVILTDRGIDTEKAGLYVSLLGSDFLREGTLVGQWLVKQSEGGSRPVNIVELQGTAGSAPAKDRAEGFSKAIAADPKLRIVASQTADFTRAKGEVVMADMLRTRHDINVVFAHNDDMALGAIKAIEAAGLRPGVDIKIISIDGVHDGMQALAAGKISFIAECSPLLGPQLMDLVQKVVAGAPVPPRIVTDETTFTPEQAKAALPSRKY